jgi:hypothetical protein
LAKARFVSLNQDYAVHSIFRSQGIRWLTLRFYDLSIGGAIYDKRLSLIVITVFVMHHRVRCLGVGYIYLSVYLYQYLCVAIYLKIILVVHLMVSANKVVDRHFIYLHEHYIALAYCCDLNFMIKGLLHENIHHLALDGDYSYFTIS